MKRFCHTRTALVLIIPALVAFLDVRPAQSQNMNYPVPGVAMPGPEVPGFPNGLETTQPTLSMASSARQDAPTGLIGTLPDLDSQVATADYNTSIANVIPEVNLASFKVGAITVKPYGILWSNMKYMSSRTFPESGQFVLWVDSEESQGENAFIVDARPSRIGVDLSGPKYDIFGGLAGGGKVEVDFLGTFSTENQPSVRLRHVYWEAKNKNMRFLTGQTWDVVSPLLPHTVNFSVNWGVGNIGFRRTQFRYERYFHLPSGMTWTVQGALAENIIQDFRSGPSAAGITRETGNWPMLQGRTALTFDSHHLAGPATIGVSGHIGETGFDFADEHPANPFPGTGPYDDARFRTWSFNVDAKLPITERLRFQGEFFTGANLSNVLGGIVQGVCPCLRVPIRSTGGWAEASYDINSCLTTNIGFGIDDPNDADSLIGRTYNRVVYANLFLAVTENLQTGFEVSGWKTLYHNRTNEPAFTPIPGPTAPGDATVLEWTVRYKF